MGVCLHVIKVPVPTDSTPLLEIWVLTLWPSFLSLWVLTIPASSLCSPRPQDGKCFPQNPPLWKLNASVLHFQSFKVCLTNPCIKFSVKITGVISVFPTGPSLRHPSDGIDFSNNPTSRLGMLDLRVTLFPSVR